MLSEERSTKKFSVTSDFPCCGSVLRNKSVSICCSVLSLVCPKWICLSGIGGVNQAHKSLSCFPMGKIVEFFNFCRD